MHEIVRMKTNLLEGSLMAGTQIDLDSQSAGLVIVDMQVEGCERHGPGGQASNRQYSPVA